MIPKTDLLNKVNELEARLQLIFKYSPSLQNIEENVRVLKSMGLEDDKIKEAISRRATYVVGTIINPICGEQMAICVEDISIKENLNTGQFEVFVDEYPFKEFFAQALMTKRKIEDLSKDNPEIKALYDENRRLKRNLAILCRK